MVTLTYNTEFSEGKGMEQLVFRINMIRRALQLQYQLPL